MELDGENALVLVSEALAGAVVDVDMAHLSHSRIHRLALDHIAVVLAGDEHPAGLDIPHRVVGPPMAIGQRAGGGPGGQRHQLVAQADGKDGQVGLVELAHLGDDLHVVGGIAGAVGEHHAVIAAGEDLLRRRVGGQQGDVTAPGVEAAGHIPLLPQVQQGNFVLRMLRRIVDRSLGGHPLHGAGHPIGAQPLQHFLHMKMLRAGDHTVHRPLIAEYLGQRPGVDTLEPGDIMLFQIGIQRTLIAEIAAPFRQAAHHKSLRPGADRLIVLMVHAIVADQGIGHHNTLARIGRIGQDLLITHHRGVEHHLADTVLRTADALSHEGTAIFQDQRRFHVKITRLSKNLSFVR